MLISSVYLDKNHGFSYNEANSFWRFAMRKSTKRGLTRVMISILYIIWGIMAPVSAIKAVLALDLTGIVTAAVGVLMLIAGFYGLIDVRRAKIRTFGVIIFVAAVLSVVLAMPTINVVSIITAVLAWLYILAVN